LSSHDNWAPRANIPTTQNRSYSFLKAGGKKLPPLDIGQSWSHLIFKGQRNKELTPSLTHHTAHLDKYICAYNIP
jgi:hypothetical protein